MFRIVTLTFKRFRGPESLIVFDTLGVTKLSGLRKLHLTINVKCALKFVVNSVALYGTQWIYSKNEQEISHKDIFDITWGPDISAPFPIQIFWVEVWQKVEKPLEYTRQYTDE